MSVSKPARSFTVTTASERVTLDDSGAARAPFTVTNTSPQALRGRLLTRPLGAAKPEWFTVVGDSVRDFGPNAAQQVVVELKVPPGTPPASYSFRLDAVSEDDPDEDFTEGPSVAFDVTAPPPPPKKFPWWILAIVGAVVLLIIIGVVIWLLVRDTGTKVPSVVGQSATAAQSTLTDAGFTVKTQSVTVTDPAQHDVVQSQDPAAGSVQPEKTEVTITAGRASVVPNVKGLTEANAKTELANANLMAAVRDVGVEEPRQDGLVLSQDPAAGTVQPPGTAVTIAVGRNVVVPNVVGLAVDNAVAVLRRAGLEPGLIRVHVSFPFNIGIVGSQTPQGGTRLPLGGVVRIRFNVFP
jgi:eukaryotic-like serine/threonine-protein kinase